MAVYQRRYFAVDTRHFPAVYQHQKNLSLYSAEFFFAIAFISMKITALTDELLWLYINAVFSTPFKRSCRYPPIIFVFINNQF